VTGVPTICLAGDYSPGRRQVRIELGDGTLLANLEGPVVSGSTPLTPAPKAGPHLRSSRLPELTQPFVASLANNHVMDFGPGGLEETVRVLDRAGHRWVGAGPDLDAARSPLQLHLGEARVAIIACCERQFGVAGRSAGVAELGPWLWEAIREARSSADLVVVSIHAGVEDAPWPSPYLRDLYRSLVRAGAGVVHGHHAHVPQGFESWDGGLILYGMGNLAVDPAAWASTPDALWSLVAEVAPGAPADATVRAASIVEEDDGSLRVRRGELDQRHREHVARCNEPLEDPDLLEALWQEVAVRCYRLYAADFLEGSIERSGSDRVRGQAVEALRTIKLILLRREPEWRAVRGRLQHLAVACESHRQLLVTASGVLAGVIEDRREPRAAALVDDAMPQTVHLR
jgi:hypothetical protein